MKRVIEENCYGELFKRALKTVLEESSKREFLKRILDDSSQRKLLKRVVNDSS